MFKRVLARCGVRGSALAAGVLGVAMVVAPAPAQAQAGNVTCTTTISVTVITGNVTVPPGAFCTLVGGTVQGNVNVDAGASGLFLDAITVQGNVNVGAGATFDAGGVLIQHNLTTERANYVNIQPIEVDGNSSFDRTSGPFVVCGGGGSACVLFNYNPGTPNPAGQTRFGNVSITNTSSPAGAVYAGNFVAGSLTCSGNTSVTNDYGFGPTPNFVLGQESGQCVGL